MEKGNEIKERAEIATLFMNLSDEAKIKVAKTLIWQTIAHNYIEAETAIYASFASAKPELNITEEMIEEKRSKLVTKVGKAVDIMVNDMLGDDIELKFKMFDHFVENMGRVNFEVRKGICGYNHDFTEWEEKIGSVPVYDEDGDIEGYVDNRQYFERKCKYCGKVEKAYSEGHKIKIEGDDEYWRKTIANPKRYVLQDKKQQN